MKLTTTLLLVLFGLLFAGTSQVQAQPLPTESDDVPRCYPGLVVQSGCTFNNCPSQSSQCDQYCMLYTRVYYLLDSSWQYGECWL